MDSMETPAETPQISNSKRWIARVGAVGLLLVGIGMAANLIFASWVAGRVYPGVAVGSVKLGGLSRAQAQARLASQAQRYHLKLEAGGKTFEADQLGASYNVATTADQAMTIGRGHYLAILGLLDPPKLPAIQYAYQVDRSILKDYVAGIVSGVGQAPVDAAIVVKDGQPQVQPDQPGRSISETRYPGERGGTSCGFYEANYRDRYYSHVQRSKVPADCCRDWELASL
jgi:hypothetical protein